eukprot:CFRG5042T1
MATMENLLTSARQLRGMAMDTGLPPVKRTPEELARLSDQLRHKNMRETDQSSQNVEDARYMMLQHGCDTSRLTRSLQQINLKKTFEPLDSLNVTDIQGYLRHEHELMVTAVIEEAEQNAIIAFNQNFTSSVEREWQQEKKDILMSLTSQTDTHMQRPVAVSDPSLLTQTLGGKWGRYAEAVKKINIEDQKFPCHVFYESFASQQVKESFLEAAWKFVDELERQKDNTPATQFYYTPSMGMRFIEQEYRLTKIQPGNNVLETLKSEIQLSDIQETHWAIIYYCLVAGYGRKDNEQASLLEYVNQNQATFRNGFPDSLKLYLCGEKADFSGSKGDRLVFRGLVQNIVARKPVSELREDSRLHEVASESIESILWHTLNSFELREKSGRLSHEYEEKISSLVSPSYPENLTFYVFLLSGMFEKAVEELKTSAEYYVDSIHFALVLSKGCLGLLDQEPLTYVQQYLRRFQRNGYVEHVLHYMFFSQDKKKPNTMNTMLDKMTQEIPVADILRLLDASFMRSIGLHPDPIWIAEQTERIGRAKEIQGQIDDAVKLFHRSVLTRKECKDVENTRKNEGLVLKLLIQQITEVLKRGNKSIEALPEVVQAHKLKTDYYEKLSSPCELKTQFLQLWKYAEFYHWYGRNDYQRSLSQLDSLDIFPTQKSAVADAINDLKKKGDNLLGASAYLVKCAMDIVCRLYRETSPSNEEQRREYRERADALMMWSGDNLSNVPQDVHSAIVEMSTNIR